VEYIKKRRRDTAKRDRIREIIAKRGDRPGWRILSVMELCSFTGRAMTSDNRMTYLRDDGGSAFITTSTSSMNCSDCVC